MIKAKHVFALVAVLTFWCQPAAAQGWWPWSKSLCADETAHWIIFNNMAKRPQHTLDSAGQSFRWYPDPWQKEQYSKLDDAQKAQYLAGLRALIGGDWKWPPDLVMQGVTTIKREGKLHYCSASIFDRANPQIGKSNVSFTVVLSDDGETRTVSFLD